MEGEVKETNCFTPRLLSAFNLPKWIVTLCRYIRGEGRIQYKAHKFS